MVASCGGSDSGGDGAAPGSAETSTATGTETATESDASADAVTVTDVPASGDEADDSADASRESPNCEAIFSLAEIEVFFAEPAVLTEGIGDLATPLIRSARHSCSSTTRSVDRCRTPRLPWGLTPRSCAPPTTSNNSFARSTIV